MDFKIDHDLFNEIGIDSQNRLGKFSKNKRKISSLITRMSGPLKDNLKVLFNKDPRITDEEFFKSLLSQNLDLCKLLDLIIYTSKHLNLDISRTIYDKEFSVNLPRNEAYLQKIVFEGYFDLNKDLLRKIHYYTYLELQQYIEATTNQNLNDESKLNLNDLDIEKLFINSGQLKQKGKIKVWYALRTDDGLAMFIYIDAKTRKMIPSTTRKKNNFIQYSKPNIIYIKNAGKKILIYSRDIERSTKYASVFFYEQSEKRDPFKVIYETKEKETRKDSIDGFIKNLINNKIPELNLESLTFFPDKAKYDGVLMKISRGATDLGEISKAITESFGTEFSCSTVQELELSYNGILFKIIFWLNGDHVIVTYNYLARNQSAGNEFSNFLNRQHEIKINKKTR